MNPVSGSTPDAIAVCQHPHGDHLHWGWGPGDSVRCALSGCDCTPRIYVAIPNLRDPEDDR